MKTPMTCGNCANFSAIPPNEYHRYFCYCTTFIDKKVSKTKKACQNWLNSDFWQQGMDDRVNPDKWVLNKGE